MISSARWAGNCSGALPSFLQHGDIESLASLGTLLPPEPQRCHVVGRDGGDGTDGVGVQMGKLKAWLLGHLLNLESQDAQLVEHGLHTAGQHAQVFGTDEHPAVLQHLGQTAQGLEPPEERMALIEVVVVESEEGILVFPDRASKMGSVVAPMRGWYMSA